MKVRLTTTSHDDLQVISPRIVEHLVSLVDDCVLDAVHAENIWLAHEVHETTTSTDEDIATLAQVLDVHAEREATVSDAWTKHRAVAHATCLVKNLHRQLAGGHEDEHERLCTNRLSLAATRTTKLLCLAHQAGDDWDEIGCGLAAA